MFRSSDLVSNSSFLLAFHMTYLTPYCQVVNHFLATYETDYINADADEDKMIIKPPAGQGAIEYVRDF